MQEIKTFREWRKTKGYTAEYVAKELEISIYTLNAKERGDWDFNQLQKKVLCELYGIDPSQVKELA